MGWMKGEFFMEFVEDEYEKAIDIDNQQILMEALQRLDRRSKFIKHLPPENEIVLISPETDMETIDAADKEFLGFFHCHHLLSKQKALSFKTHSPIAIAEPSSQMLNMRRWLIHPVSW